MVLDINGSYVQIVDFLVGGAVCGTGTDAFVERPDVAHAEDVVVDEVSLATLVGLLRDPGAEVLDRRRQGAGVGVGRRPLEDHVLDEVREPGLLHRLVARPHADEAGQHGGVDVRDVEGLDAEAVGQRPERVDVHGGDI